MNALIIFAHNEPKSFNASMKNLAVEVLQQQGHNVIVSDLYAMKFKAVADADDFRERANPNFLTYALEQRHAYQHDTLAPDIAAEIEKVKWADLIIFHFPVYWFAMPAIMKGWVDRVFISGYCYGGKRFYDRGGLAGKKAMIACTVGGQLHMLQPGGIHGDLQLMLQPALQGTLAYVGMTVLPPFVAYHIPYISREDRIAYLEEYARHLQTLDQRPPLAFPSLNDYDDQLHPLRTSCTSTPYERTT